MLNKNDVVTVEITDIGVGGEGIGRVDGYTLFIKDAIIGDVVEAKVMKAKKNYGYARMMEIIHPSADRVEPKCAFARKCGGCQIQEMSYERQLAFKEQKIRGNLERIGGFDRGKIDAVMEPVEGMDEPFRYRNKAQFPFGTDKEGNPVTGFYAGRTHDIIANTECILGVEQNREILEIILQYMKENCVAAYDEKSGKGLIRHVLIRYGFTTKEIMVCLVINGTKLPKADRLIKKLTQLEGMTSITLSPNTRRDNVIMGNSYEVLWGQGFITDYIGNVKYQISPLSFYQVNPVQTEKLYGLALEYADLKGTKPYGICIAVSEQFLSSLHRRQSRSMELRSCRRQSKMQRIMRRSMRSIMQRSMLERQKKFCRTIMKNMLKLMVARRHVRM